MYSLTKTYKFNSKDNNAPIGFFDIKNFSTLKLSKHNYAFAPDRCISKYYVMASNFIKMAHN